MSTITDPETTAVTRRHSALRAGRTAARWRIEEYEGEDRLPRYAVYRGAQRAVWGLRTKATAARWILRLGGVISALEPDPLPDPAAAPQKPALLEQYGGRTPWWSN